MRLKHLLQFVLVLVMSAGFFACSSTRYYEFAKTGSSHQSKMKEAPATEAIAQAGEATAPEQEPVLEASTEAVPATVAKPASHWEAPAAPAVAQQPAAPAQAPALTTADYTKPAFTPAAKLTKQTEKKGIFAKLKAVKATVLEIILAIFLPPIAVLLHDGVGTSFWINILLTLLFFLPGVIHALLVVTDNI